MLFGGENQGSVRTSVVPPHHSHNIYLHTQHIRTHTHTHTEKLRHRKTYTNPCTQTKRTETKRGQRKTPETHTQL